MGYPLSLAIRYLGSKKRSFVSIGTVFATLGVTLGVAALTIVMSVTGGFQEQFREKVLGVNAHVLVLKYSVDFREYRDVMNKVEHVPGVIGVAPFVINPMMVTHGDRTATGVLLKGVDPQLMPQVLDLPRHIVAGSLEGLRRPGAKPPERTWGGTSSWLPTPSAKAPAGPGLDDATSGKSLLKEIERRIEDDEDDAPSDSRPQLEHSTPSTPKSAPPFATAGEEPTAASMLPGGSVTPEGGFRSELPSEDILPDTVDPDACRSEESRRNLPGVVLGRSLARQLNVDLGDCMQVTSPTIGISAGASGRPPIAKQFRVIAIFEAGFDQYDSKLVYTDLFEAQAFYEYGDSVTGVEMKVSDINEAHGISKTIDALLSNSVYHTMDWRELNHGLFTALLIQKLVMSLVLAMMIVVAAFTVIATLIMMVLDKKKEIAVLKAIGATNEAILRVFLYQGGIIGMVGTTLGLLLGFGCCKALAAYEFPLDPKVYFISKVPVNIRPEEFAFAAVFALGVCMVATVFPSLHAARLRPSDGMRGE